MVLDELNAGSLSIHSASRCDLVAVMSSHHPSSSVASSLYGYDDSSSDESDSHYGAEYKMSSMGSIPTVAPGRDISRLPPPDSDDDTTTATIATSVVPLATVPAPIMESAILENSNTSLEFTVQRPYQPHQDNELYHASTETFPTSNVGSGGSCGGGKKPKPKILPRSVEPSPFLPYEDHLEEKVGGGRAVQAAGGRPQTKGSIRPGEGLKPYLPYDSSDDIDLGDDLLAEVHEAEALYREHEYVDDRSRIDRRGGRLLQSWSTTADNITQTGRRSSNNPRSVQSIVTSSSGTTASSLTDTTTGGDTANTDNAVAMIEARAEDRRVMMRDVDSSDEENDGALMYSTTLEETPDDLEELFATAQGKPTPRGIQINDNEIGSADEEKSYRGSMVDAGAEALASVGAADDDDDVDVGAFNARADEGMPSIVGNISENSARSAHSTRKDIATTSSSGTQNEEEAKDRKGRAGAIALTPIGAVNSEVAEPSATSSVLSPTTDNKDQEEAKNASKENAFLGAIALASVAASGGGAAAAATPVAASSESMASATSGPVTEPHSKGHLPSDEVATGDNTPVQPADELDLQDGIPAVDAAAGFPTSQQSPGRSSSASSPAAIDTKDGHDKQNTSYSVGAVGSVGSNAITESDVSGTQEVESSNISSHFNVDSEEDMEEQSARSKDATVGAVGSVGLNAITESEVSGTQEVESNNISSHLNVDSEEDMEKQSARSNEATVGAIALALVAGVGIAAATSGSTEIAEAIPSQALGSTAAEPPKDALSAEKTSHGVIETGVAAVPVVATSLAGASLESSLSPASKDKQESKSQQSNNFKLQEASAIVEGPVEDMAAGQPSVEGDLESGGVTDDLKEPPIGVLRVCDKSAYVNDNGHKTEPTIWIFRVVFVGIVISIVILSAILFPRRQEEETMPTLAPTPILPSETPQPTLVTISPTDRTFLPESSAPTMLATMQPTVQSNPSVPLPTQTSSPVLTISPTPGLTSNFEATAIFAGRGGNKFGTIVSLNKDGNFLAVLNLNPTGEPVQAFAFRDTTRDGFELWNALPRLPLTLFNGTSVTMSGASLSLNVAITANGNSVVAFSTMYGFEVFELVDNREDGTMWNKRGEAMKWESGLSEVEETARFTSVALSSNGSILAAGYLNKKGDSIVVRVFQFDESTREWTQIGNTIGRFSPERLPPFLSFSLALSGGGTILTLGDWAVSNPPVAIEAFQWDGMAWISLGEQITLDFGPVSLSLSEDGKRVALATPAPGIGGVYKLDALTESWSPVGKEFMGGSSISLNAAGDRVILGNALTSLTSILDFESIDWVRTSTLVGNPGSQFGKSTSVSADGNKVAIGAPQEDQSGSNLGRATIFE